MTGYPFYYPRYTPNRQCPLWPTRLPVPQEPPEQVKELLEKIMQKPEVPKAVEEIREYVQEHGLEAIVAFHKAKQKADIAPIELKKSRQRRDIDVTEMAEAMGETVDTITSWENGANRILNEDLDRWREAIDAIVTKRK